MKDPYEPSPAKIVKIKKETRDVKTFTVKSAGQGGQAWNSIQPGQFVMISLFGFGEAPFSLSSIHEGPSFETTIRVVGNLTARLFKCVEGDNVGVRGPYGRGWPIQEAQGKDVLIIAGGIGLSPLKPVIEHISRNRALFGRLEILYGARSPDEMVHVDEFANWNQIKDARLLLTVDRVSKGLPWDHEVGVVPILFNKLETSPNNSIVLTCGPEIMMHFVVRDLLSRGFEEGQLYVSLERRMKCGIAQCGHCQIGPKYVCKDGPVFPYAELSGLPDLTL
ncbi:MAG: FAD/NAD(P)-binding protein [Candidatus Bathyarchaeia archaeon]